MASKLLKNTFELLPDSNLKKAIRYKYYNITKKYDFKIYLKRGGYKVIIYGLPLYFENEPFYELRAPIPGYFRYYQFKRDDVIIDAGAYPGVFAIIAAKLVGENGKVFAFEPDKKNCEELQRNIKRNQISNITIIQKGLWSRNTELQFKTTGGDSSTLMTNDHKGNAITSVNVTTLDDFVKEYSLNRINFIKMDIEGAEIEALKGSANTLREFDVNLAIASYHEVDGKKTSHKVERLLREYGYDAKTNYPMHFTTYGSKR
ncbi:MAG: FkbM family methyltransferase [Thermoplasmata archaeon]|nr:MAG: FkbM family methyltransferase [Thermoplasmata archaeon]